MPLQTMVSGKHAFVSQLRWKDQNASSLIWMKVLQPERFKPVRAYFDDLGLDVDDEPGPQHLNVSVSTGREPFTFEKLP